jgi:hypothetical protein
MHLRRGGGPQFHLCGGRRSAARETKRESEETRSISLGSDFPS